MPDSVHICRVCLADGARNIFQNNVVNDDTFTVASVSRIAEKLQFVTQLEVAANDGLPLWICELCIIQLNLAYRFKQMATESDRKLRQRLVGERSIPVENSDAIMLELKHEPEKSTNEVMEGCADLSIATPSLESSGRQRAEPINVTRHSVEPHMMVSLRNFSRDPAEDAAFIKSIIKKELISPMERLTPTSQTQPEPTKTPNSRGNSKVPVAKGSKSENRPSNFQTTPRVKGTGKTKPKNKITTSLDKSRRLQKVLDSLRIDMVNDNQQHPWQPIPNIIHRRRNSICVSSFSGR